MLFLDEVRCQEFPTDKPQSEKPTPAALKAAITHALKHGCAKGTKVFIYGPTNAGKSHILEALITLFGDFAFTRPVGRANNYPLQDLFGKKVVVLHDFRTTTYRLDLDGLLVWFECGRLRAPAPQNHEKGDLMYGERAPIFCVWVFGNHHSEIRSRVARA